MSSRFLDHHPGTRRAKKGGRSVDRSSVCYWLGSLSPGVPSVSGRPPRKPFWDSAWEVFREPPMQILAVMGGLYYSRNRPELNEVERTTYAATGVSSSLRMSGR